MWPRYGDCSIFQDGGRRHVGFFKFQIFNGRGGQEVRSASLCQIAWKSLETRTRYVSFNIMLVWLENAYSRPFFLGGVGTFPPNDITHRSNPKRTILVLNHVIWAINREYRSRGLSCALVRVKRTGQDATGQEKKSQRGNISPICGEAPTEAMHMKICVVGDVLDIITCAKFQSEIFRGYDFTVGRIFHFSYLFWMSPRTVQRYCAACDVIIRSYSLSQVTKILWFG